MLAVIGAMKHEIGGLRRLAAVGGVDQSDGATIHHAQLLGKSFLLASSGVGRRNAMRALRVLADSYPVTTVLSIGYAGGLNKALGPGAVVVCSRMACPDEDFSHILDGDPSLLGAARRCGRGKVVEGTGVTARHLISSPAEKRSLFDMFRADVVDMESYWIMAAAAECGIPCLVVRAISDGAADRVPELDWFNRTSMMKYFLMHPGDGIRLYSGLRKSLKNLTNFTSEMIEAVA